MYLGRSALLMTAVLSFAVLSCSGQNAESSATGVPERPDRTQSSTPPSPVGRPTQVRQAQMRAPVNRLYLLEERLNRALRGILPRSTPMEGVPAPVVPPPTIVRANPDRGQRERDRNDLLFSSPEKFAEQDASRQWEDLMKTDDMRSEARMKPEERWLRDFNKNTRSSMDRGNEDSRSGLDFDYARNRSETEPENVSRSEERLRTILQAEGVRPDTNFRNERDVRDDRLASSFGGFGRKDEDSYLEQYRRLLNPQAPALRPTELASSVLSAPGSDPMRSLRTPALDAYSSGSSANNSIFTQPFGANVNPVLTPRLQMDATERVLNQWNQFYIPPPEPTRSSIPARPTFEAPRRKF